MFSILESKAKVHLIKLYDSTIHHIHFLHKAGGVGQVRVIDTQVMVASAQKNLCTERMKICTLLWDAGIKVRRGRLRERRLTNGS